MGELNRLEGKKLKCVTLSPDRDLITFTLHDDSVKVFRAKGECCSHSWIEHLELPSFNIDGAVILRVEEKGFGVGANCTTCGIEHDLDERSVAGCVFDTMQASNPNKDESIKVYRTTVVTDRGCIDIEYRNSSNGYYGGWLEEVEETEMETENATH